MKKLIYSSSLLITFSIFLAENWHATIERCIFWSKPFIHSVFNFFITIRRICWARKNFPFELEKCYFYNFCNMKSRVVMLKNYFGFSSFRIFSIAHQRLETHIGVTFNFSGNSEGVWHGFSSSNACNSAYSNFFDCPERCLSSTQKSPLWKRWNHSLHVLFDGDSLP